MLLQGDHGSNASDKCQVADLTVPLPLRRLCPWSIDVQNTHFPTYFFCSQTSSPSDPLYVRSAQTLPPLAFDFGWVPRMRTSELRRFSGSISCPCTQGDPIKLPHVTVEVRLRKVHIPEQDHGKSRWSSFSLASTGVIHAQLNTACLLSCATGEQARFSRRSLSSGPMSPAYRSSLGCRRLVSWRDLNRTRVTQE